MKIIKRFKLLSFSLTAALLLPTAVFADTSESNVNASEYAAGWQDVGYLEPMYVNTRFQSAPSQTWKSGGGSFRIKFNFSGANSFKVYLYEKDESGNAPEKLVTKTVTYSGQWLQWDNINDYVDGGNGAELYIVLGAGTNNADVIVQAQD